MAPGRRLVNPSPWRDHDSAPRSNHDGTRGDNDRTRGDYDCSRSRDAASSVDTGGAVNYGACFRRSKCNEASGHQQRDHKIFHDLTPLVLVGPLDNVVGTRKQQLQHFNSECHLRDKSPM